MAATRTEICSPLADCRRSRLPGLRPRSAASSTPISASPAANCNWPLRSLLSSRTTAATVGEQEAKKLGLRHFHRDVFLDNDQYVPAILKQLRHAESLAKSKGQAIAIGHPHPETLAAIKQWLKDKDPSVHVVPLTALGPE